MVGDWWRCIDSVAGCVGLLGAAMSFLKESTKRHAMLAFTVVVVITLIVQLVKS